MDWLKKKKDEAKTAAAKMSNKRTAFKGEGNVLGGTTENSSAPPSAAVSQRPFMKFPLSNHKPAALSEEEQKKRRELQAAALEERGNAWDKRVATARKARLQQEEQDNKFQYTEPVSAESKSFPPSDVLSNEEVKARELQSAQTQMGFNPYAATFASSSQALSAMNAIGGESQAVRRPIETSIIVPPSSTTFPDAPYAGSGAVPTSLDTGENGAVYVLLNQDPSCAITAAETLIKLLDNILLNPQEEKFRKIRLSNKVIESKLVAVPGAIEILEEAGFSRIELDGDVYLMLTEDAFESERVQSAINRTEVGLVQLHQDSVES